MQLGRGWGKNVGLVVREGGRGRTGWIAEGWRKGEGAEGGRRVRVEGKGFWEMGKKVDWGDDAID